MGDPFRLAMGEVLQGDLKLDVPTLVLVFQVNCPGCLAAALPQAEAIHRERDRLGLQVLALSTAFEDFDLNTVANTRALLEEGRLVGASRAALGRDDYPGELTLPVALDAGMAHGVGETFASNGLLGTPSWILLDSDGRARSRQFGHLHLRPAS